jgi:hypothetical protein
MNITFDGDNKLMVCGSGTTELNIRKLYSMWKEWVMQDDNMKYLSAFRVVGGDPTVGDKIITPYFFLLNGWKIRPQKANHTLKVDGILLTDDDSDPFTDVDGNYRIAIQAIVPIYTETLKVGSGLSPEEHDKLMSTPDKKDVYIANILTD